MIFFNKLVLLLFFFLIACSSKKDPISEKEYEPNVQKRQEEFLKKEGSINTKKTGRVFKERRKYIIWQKTWAKRKTCRRFYNVEYNVESNA